MPIARSFKTCKLYDVRWFRDNRIEPWLVLERYLSPIRADRSCFDIFTRTFDLRWSCDELFVIITVVYIRLQSLTERVISNKT